MYLPTTSESSAEDSSFESSAGPSRKICRSPTTIVTLSIHATSALVLSRADLFPPRKRFRDSILPEDSVEEDIDANELTNIEADARTDEVAVDKDVEARVDVGIGMEVDVGVDVEDEVEDEVESSDRGTMEVGLDVVVGIDIPDGMLMPNAVKRLEQLEERSLIAGGERAILLEQVNDDNSGNGRDGNGGNGNGGNGNLNDNKRGARPVDRECTYQDFIKCQPLNFKGTEGVDGLIRWFEKMETVFHISNCPEKYQVKYATCTLLNSALTWWNSHKRTVGTDAAFAMSWRELMKLMAGVYCPRNKIQKMESKLWNLTVKNNDLAAYT
ncbi:putative reverse transcriptase domain-containing protein [Tanacetum coccineum]